VLTVVLLGTDEHFSPCPCKGNFDYWVPINDLCMTFLKKQLNVLRCL